MQRKLGKSDISVSEVGIGCWAIGGPDWNLGLEMGWGPVDDSEILSALRKAVDLGANHFDTADIYGHGRSERLIGSMLSRTTRTKIVIGTKVGYFSGTACSAYHPVHIRHQLETSLVNLQTDYVDIYYFHNFNFGTSDVYLEDAIDTLNRLKEEGKIRAKGMRGPHRYAPERISATKPVADKYQRFLDVASRLDPDVIQVRYNILTPSYDNNSERDIFKWAEDQGVGVVINKPFAQGLLLDKYDPKIPPSFSPGDHRRRKAWFTPHALGIIQKKLAILKNHFGSESSELVRIALQYCLSRGKHSCVLAGFTTMPQLTTNLSAANKPLSEEEVTFIRETMSGVNHELGLFFAAGEHATR